MTEAPKDVLPVAAQAAAVRQMMRDDAELTLDAIAGQHPDLTQGVDQVRTENAKPTKVGSGSVPMARRPIDQL